MARRVKKTDTREVDHWVSTDDGRHLPIDKDGNIIFSSSKKSTSKSGSKYKKKAVDEDKLYEIADRYNSSEPVSGDWNTELDHEIAAIQKEFNLSKSEAKDAMKKYLGFTDDDFADDEPAPSSKSKSSSSEKPKSEAPAKELTRKQKVLNDDKVQNLLNTAKGSWSEGIYEDSDGGKFEIGYEVDDYYNIYQTSDGQVFDDSKVQRMVEGVDSGKYHAWNNQGQLLITSSAKAAVKHAWGTPKEAGVKREAPKESDAKKPTPAKKLIQMTDKQKRAAQAYLKSVVWKTAVDGEQSAEISDRHWGWAGMSNEKMANILNAVDTEHEYRIEHDTEDTWMMGVETTVKHNYIVRDKITPEVAGSKKRSSAATSAKKPTRKPASSKTNKVRQLVGNDRDMAEWKISRAYDKTSLKNIALDAGVPSSKVRTMSTEELRAMLLSMWKGR